MTIEFGDLLFRLLPGLYRDKDVSGELRRFLDILALPLAELDASIAQLHDDQLIGSCRSEFIGLIGSLVAADIDPTLPERAQRAEVQHAVEFYRTKGLLTTLETLAEEVTGWRVTLVDFSGRVAQTATLESSAPAPMAPLTLDVSDPMRLDRLGRPDDPALYSIDIRAPRHTRERAGHRHFDNVGFFFVPSRRLGNQPAHVLPSPSQSGRFTFDAAGVRIQLLDGFDGQPITRRALQGQERAFCGARRGFMIRVNDLSVTDPSILPPLRIMSADLEDFDNAKDADGRDLPLEPDPSGESTVDVAIDPQSGRFFLSSGVVKDAAERVRVDYLLAAVDATDTERVVQSLLQRLPKALPAGIVPVMIDVRQTAVDRAHLL